MTKSVLYTTSPLGALRIAALPAGICEVSLCESCSEIQPPVCGDADALAARCAAQLGEYFAGQRRIFDLPLALQGTAFQRRVWQALCAIPYGETRTYAEIAVAVGCPKGCRAVGMANHRNPVMIVVPCHRVVQTGGGLGGYAGGISAKYALLALEGSAKA